MTLAWFQDPDEAPPRGTPPDPTTHRWMTDSQWRRAICDVYAPYLNADGACDACGGKNGHAGSCPNLAAEIGTPTVSTNP
jgi:hypothetical protein